MNSSVDTAAFDVAMSEALAHPEVVAYLDDVRSSFRFKWQLKILPASVRPLRFKHVARSFAVIVPGLVFLKVKIFLAPPEKIPLHVIVLHELAHVAQAIQGYFPGDIATPFAEHDADVRVTKISTYPIIDTKSDIMLAAFAGRYNQANPSLKIRNFLYANNANRAKLMLLLQKDKDPVITQFLSSEWVSHGRYDLWNSSTLDASLKDYKTWIRNR